MNGLLLLENGFEDSEALTTRDILMRAGINMTTATSQANKVVITSHNLVLLADKYLDEVNESDFDFVVLPGGMGGTLKLDSLDKVKELIKEFYSNNKVIAAICAAPMVFGHLGLLSDKSYTCFVGCNEGLDGNYTAEPVQIDGNIITGRSVKYSIDFALAIIEKVLGIEVRNKVANQIEGK